MIWKSAFHGGYDGSSWRSRFEELLKTRDEVSDKPDTKIDVDRMTVLRYDYEKSLKTVMDFLRSFGFGWERVHMADYLQELGSLAAYPDETKAAYKKEFENVYAWIFTPDENYGKGETDKISCMNGLAAYARRRWLITASISFVFCPERHLDEKNSCHSLKFRVQYKKILISIILNQRGKGDIAENSSPGTKHPMTYWKKGLEERTS